MAADVAFSGPRDASRSAAALARGPLRIPAPARWDGWAVTTAFSLTGVVIAAGGLGVAPAVALAGVIALPARFAARFWRGPATASAAFWLATAFFLWAVASWTWSPYEPSDRVVRLALGAPVFAAFAAACGGLTARDRTLAERLLVFAAFSASVVFALEMATDGALTRAYGRTDRPQTELWRNLGHGVSTLVALTPAVIALTWDRGWAARGVAAFVAVTAGVAGVVFGLTSNLLGVVAAAAAMGLAWAFPRFGVRAAGVVAAVSVAAGPAFALFAVTPRAWRAAIPHSWEQRVEIWRRVAADVWEAPLFGHGLDAIRTVSEDMELRGEIFDVLALHPHNAGLHVWYETGLVGVALLSATLVLATARLARTARLSRPVAAAWAGGIAAFAAMASVSYGVWQEWWVATAFLVMGACVLVGTARGERVT